MVKLKSIAARGMKPRRHLGLHGFYSIDLPEPGGAAAGPFAAAQVRALVEGNNYHNFIDNNNCSLMLLLMIGT